MTFHELYTAHFSFVWRTLCRFGVPEAEIADGIQDVFLVVYRRLPEFEPRAKITTWLFRICERTARDRRRRVYRRYEVAQDADWEPELVSGTDVGATFERQEELRQLGEILDKMEETQRDVFVLFELEGLPGMEIAERLGIPLATVHSRLRLARLAFHKAVHAAEVREDFAGMLTRMPSALRGNRRPA